MKAFIEHYKIADLYGIYNDDGEGFCELSKERAQSVLRDLSCDKMKLPKGGGAIVFEVDDEVWKKVF
jgi:hypothetical protein